MPVTLYQADGVLVPPVADARLYEMLSGGAVGIVQGCEITSIGGNQLQITSGWGVCLGRVFFIEQETINATTSTGGEVTGRLLLVIDVYNGEAPIAFVTQAQSPLPELVQEDINLDGNIYQIPLAIYNIGKLSISGLRTVYPITNVSGIGIYTHTKSGTVHEFTGTGANGRAKMTADVQAGDTFTVNGAPVTAYMGADSAVDAMAGSPWNGKWVSFIVEGSTLNFKGGGGKVTVTGLTADVVKKGTTVTVKQGAKTVASVVGTYKGVPCLCYCCVYCHPDDWNGTRAMLTSFDPSFIDTKNAYSTNGGSVTFTIKRSAKIRCYSSGAENYNHNRMTIKIDGTTLGDGTMLTVNNGSKITIPYNAPGSNRGRAGAFCIFESD